MDFRLQRSELVALLNLMGRLSDSVEYIRLFRERVRPAASAEPAQATAPDPAAAPLAAADDATSILTGPGGDGLDLLVGSLQPFLPYAVALAVLYLAVLYQTRRCVDAPATVSKPGAHVKPT